MKGDLNGSRLVANQIAAYRRIHDRNLQASIMIGTKAQSMYSDHKVNKGQVESIKGFTYANVYESFTRAEAREQRYAYRMSAINHLESSVKDSLEDAYRNGDDEAQKLSGNSESADATTAKLQEFEVQMILNQALGKEKNRVYIAKQDDSIEPPFILHVRSFENRQLGSSITLNPIVSTPNTAPVFSVNVSTIDFVKRCIIQDPFVVGQLNLYGEGQIIRPFSIGKLNAETRQFEELAFDDSVLDAELESGDTIFVRLMTTANTNFGGHDAQDEELRERINRINLRH
jgi:hypothetical protein